MNDEAMREARPSRPPCARVRMAPENMPCDMEVIIAFEVWVAVQSVGSAVTWGPNGCSDSELFRHPSPSDCWPLALAIRCEVLDAGNYWCPEYAAERR